MLAHADENSARAHDQAVCRSLASGVLDLHALVTARLQTLGDSAVQPMTDYPWALGVLPPAAFAASEVVLAPPEEAKGDDMFADDPFADDTKLSKATSTVYRLPCSLPGALLRIDAFVALATARAASEGTRSAPRPRALSVRERATCLAAQNAVAWPKIRLDAAFHPDAAVSRGRARGEAIAAHLDAIKAPHRPVFVWFGPRALTDMLSPYIRDVGYALLQEGPRALLQAGQTPPATKDAYTLAEAICASEPALDAERARVESAIGITRVGLADSATQPIAEIIDIAQLPSDACDSALLQFVETGGEPQALVVCLAWDTKLPGHEAAAVLQAMSARAPVASVAACLDWPHLASPPSGEAPYVFRAWARPREHDDASWPWHESVAPACPLKLPLHADLRVFCEALAPSRLAARHVVLGTAPPQNAREATRAFAAYAATQWAQPLSRET